MRDQDELGRRGEQAAAEYLERAGLRILDRNWRCEASWLAVQGLHFDEVRIDVIGPVRDGPGEFTLEHVRGVG